MITDIRTGKPTVIIRNRLEVIGGRAVVVPGCEPTSAVTSVTLLREQRGICKNTLVDIQAALDAIPGSSLEFGTNFGNVRQTWFVLPAVPYGCCGMWPVDWYKILRELPPLPETIEHRFDNCNTFGAGFCPSGDFRLGQSAGFGGPLANAPSTSPSAAAAGRLYGGDGPAMPSTYVPEGTDVIRRSYAPTGQPSTGTTVDLPT